MIVYEVTNFLTIYGVTDFLTVHGVTDFVTIYAVTELLRAHLGPTCPQAGPVREVIPKGGVKAGNDAHILAEGIQ